jgi:hypothetical protein
MPEKDEHPAPVKTRAALVDPASMRVVWANEAASEGLPDRAGGSGPDSGPALEEIVPMAQALGAAEAMQAVADTGVAQHLQTDLVSTSRGSVAMVTSIYRLPGGMLLVLTENTWHPSHR